MEELLAWLVGALITGFVGYCIGSRAGMGGSGFTLGFLLGPCGWVLLYFMMRMNAREASVEATQRAEAVRRVPCPMCREPVIRGARLCPHCRSPLDWSAERHRGKIVIPARRRTGPRR